MKFSQKEALRNRWINPLVIAVLAAAVAAGGNALVALLNGTAQRETEQVKDDKALLLEAIKANSDPDKAAANLRFFVDTALIANRRKEIDYYLKNRKQGEGAPLPSANVQTIKEYSSSDLFSSYAPAIGILNVVGRGADGNEFQNSGTFFVISASGYALTVAHLFNDSLEIGITISLGSKNALKGTAQLVQVYKQFKSSERL